jgi:hypothetical protein
MPPIATCILERTVCDQSAIPCIRAGRSRHENRLQVRSPSSARQQTSMHRGERASHSDQLPNPYLPGQLDVFILRGRRVHGGTPWLMN